MKRGPLVGDRIDYERMAASYDRGRALPPKPPTSGDLLGEAPVSLSGSTAGSRIGNGCLVGSARRQDDIDFAAIEPSLRQSFWISLFCTKRSALEET